MAAEPRLISSTVAYAPGHAVRRDAFYWRLVATGLCFAVFGVGALVVGGLWLPLVRALSGGHSDQRARARAALRRGMHFFVETMRRLGVLTYEFQGVERLGRPGQLILANHPSLIDAVFLLAFTPDAGCVVKQAMRRNPLTRAAVNAAGFIGNDCSAAMIEGAAAALQSGQCLIMFPEGTRTTPGRPLDFHRGAANIALRAASVVTPVYIRCYPTTLTKAEPWYRIPPRRVYFRLEVGEDIDPAGQRGARPLPIASRALNERLRAGFEKELERLDNLYLES